MTALAHRLPDLVPAIDGVREVHEILDRVDVERGLARGGVGEAVREVERAITRLQAVKLRLLAQAQEQRVGEAAGLTGTTAWLAGQTHATGAEAASQVRLASALGAGHLPVTMAALDAGTVSTQHAQVIVSTNAQLPEGLSAVERGRVEAALVRDAERVDPAELRRRARRALAAAQRSVAEVDAHEDATLRTEEDQAYAACRLTLRDQNDGTFRGTFVIPSFAAAILRKTIQEIASPRRAILASRAAAAAEAASADGDLTSADAPSEQVGEAGALFGLAVVGSTQTDGFARAAARPGTATAPGGAEASATGGPAGSTESGWLVNEIDWPQRYGQAFVELLEHLPTDKLHGKVAATVVVTIDEGKLRDNLGAAHLDTGQDLSASQARRAACNAGLLPVVLGGMSLPLDLGRTQRFFTEHQHVALATIYDTCAAVGCDRPYAWSELHHQDPWASKQGATDLHLAVPLCGFHHRRVHSPDFDHRIHTDAQGRKSVTFFRRG